MNNKIYQIFKIGYGRVGGRVVNYYAVNVILSENGLSLMYIVDTGNVDRIKKYLTDIGCINSYIEIPYTKLTRGNLNNSQVCNEQQALSSLHRLLGDEIK
jgi:hypothetical protein